MAHLTTSTLVVIAFDIVRTQVPLGVVRRLKLHQVLPITLLPHAVACSSGLDLFNADYGQADGVVCCRPIAGNSDLFLARSQRPLEKPKEPLSLHKLHRSQAKSDLGSASIVDRVLVDLTVRLGDISMTVGGLTELKAGELIRLEQPMEEPLPISIGGRHFGQGEIVSAGGGRYGLKIVELAPTDDIL